MQFNNKTGYETQQPVFKLQNRFQTMDDRVVPLNLLDDGASVSHAFRNRLEISVRKGCQFQSGFACRMTEAQKFQKKDI